MKRNLRVLIVEDSEFDAQMMASIVRKSGYDVTVERVETAEAMQTALASKPWDIILADYNLPSFSAPEALKLVQNSGLDIPFIIVSGGIGEATAVAAMKAGAHDYLMKGNLNRLAPAVERELREAANRSERKDARRALRDSEMRYRLLWENSPEAVILMDPQADIHFANPAVKEVFGYEPDEIIGKNLAVLQPAGFTAQDQGSLVGCLQDAKKTKWRGIEATGLRKDGDEIDIEASFSDMEVDGKRLYVSFIRDVTERKRTERTLRENEEQFRVAREIQQRLFPKGAPEIPGFDIAGVTYPADSTGGDYFDYLPMLSNRLGLVVADVTGHGVGPALLMAETRAYLRTLAGNREDVGEILTRANSILAEDVGRERYVTLFLGRLDPQKRSLCYVNAGHPAGYILGPKGSVREQLKRTGPALGIIPDSRFTSTAETVLSPGEILLLLTDGIEEAMSPDNTLFGIDRVLDLVRVNRGKRAKEILEILYRAVRDFSQNGAQLDDVTAMLVKVL